MINLTSRKEAKSLGLKKFFTGRPCKNGHISEKYTSNGQCCTCRHNLNTSEKALQYAKDYRDKNYEKVNNWIKTYRKENPEIVSATAKKYREKNIDVKRRLHSKRRAMKKNATVAWADSARMNEIFKQRIVLDKEIGVLHNTDHIVPLQHPLVCGLHNEFNLQNIPAVENFSKGNRYWPDMPDDIQEALKFYYHE